MISFFYAGGFGSVFAATERLTNLKRSIKIVDKRMNPIEIKTIFNEIQNLCNLVFFFINS